jgi:HEAT repeat protein
LPRAATTRITPLRRRSVSLLRREAPEIRAGSCRCAPSSPAAIALLTELLDDADRVVAREAACALGRMGRTEARPSLLRLLREAPSAAVIDSITAVADEECLVILGRIARTRPDLADAALAALDSVACREDRRYLSAITAS